MKCDHPDFRANMAVSRITDTRQFQADVTIQCSVCGMPFRFIGLPCGLDMNGAAVSVDGTEARLAIAPRSQVETPLDNPQSGSDACLGFTVRRAL